MFLFRPPTRLVKGTAIATLLLFTPLVVSAVASYRAFNLLVANEFRLQQLSDRITYLDEVYLPVSVLALPSLGHLK